VPCLYHVLKQDTPKSISRGSWKQTQPLVVQTIMSTNTSNQAGKATIWPPNSPSIPEPQTPAASSTHSRRRVRNHTGTEGSLSMQTDKARAIANRHASASTTITTDPFPTNDAIPTIGRVALNPVKTSRGQVPDRPSNVLRVKIGLDESMSKQIVPTLTCIQRQTKCPLVF
jgi:hypothetical protein